MCVPILYYEQTNTFGLQLVQKNTHIKKRSFIQIAKTKIKKLNIGVHTKKDKVTELGSTFQPASHPRKGNTNKRVHVSVHSI